MGFQLPYLHLHRNFHPCKIEKPLLLVKLIGVNKGRLVTFRMYILKTLQELFLLCRISSYSS